MNNKFKIKINDKYKNNQKPNITLKNISDFKICDPLLILKKLFCELKLLCNKSRTKCISSNTKQNKLYKDMLSVIICTCRDYSYSLKTIASLTSTDFNNYEIIIVNNSDKKFPNNIFDENIIVINQPTPGLSLSRNKGADIAKGKYLLYLDDDAIAHPDLLKIIYNTFSKRHDFGVIGGQIYLDIPIPKPDILLEGKENLWSSYTVPYKKFKRVKEQYEMPYGACFAVRHSVMDKVDGFSLNYGRCGNDFAGGEETALCYSVQKCGYKIGIEPKAVVTHMVDPKRFSKEHVAKTIFAGITTTYRLSKDGYLDYIWTEDYIKTRIDILNKEIKKLSQKTSTDIKNKTYINNLIFYKECELKAFKAVLNKIVSK